MRSRLCLALFAGLFAAACGGGDPPPSPDTEVPPIDAPVEPPDAAPPDAGPETECMDGLDNDGDGDTDCADSDCAAAVNCIPETDCADTVDNDLDGDVDCADGDCALAPNCNPEANCNDGLDDDLDGDIDCADSDCAADACCNPEQNCGDTVDDDCDGAADCADTDCEDFCLAGCPAGSSVAVYSAADLPQVYDGVAVVDSVVTVVEDGRVTAAAVRLNATHPYVSDTDAYLISSDGTTIELSTGNGGSGDDFVDTEFTDVAATSITAGVAPFTGPFQPEQPFSTLLGEASAGDWTLHVEDNFAAADDGTVTGFDLFVCWCNGTPGCEVGAACRDGVDDDGDGLIDCADPDCSAAPNCNPEPICDDGVDNDFDGAADCLDADCDGVVGCEFGTELSCADGFDNDADGAVDCLDADCDGVSGCELGTELTCTDLFDNDADGAVDCDDLDCAADVWCTAEADCADGLDNDGDGFADCLDIGCNGLDGCEFGTEVSCSDGLDNDGDGVDDCSDPDCAGAFFCVPQPCPVGSTPTLVAATDNPQPIPDNPAISSEAVVTTVGVVTRVAVYIDLTHTWNEDLDITLRSPAGTVRALSTDNGGSGDNYTDTIFIDSAATPITAGTSPFTGQFRPEQPLSDFHGEGAAGSWDLLIDDDFDSDTGTLLDYQVFLCTCNGTAGCEFGAACRDGVDNDGDSLADCLDSDCAADPTCIPESNCNDAVDNDLDGATDCADLDCNGISGCEFGTEATCTDAFDNDADGAADCSDGDCAANPACVLPESNCTDGVDNDFDTLIDCADPDCGGIAGCESESNNTAVTADDFATHAVGGRVRGHVSPSGDHDYFVITVPPGSDVFFAADTFDASGNQTCATIDTLLDLFDSTGSGLIEGDDDDGIGFCSRIARVLSPGTYYLRVRAFSGTLAYQLYVATIPISTPVAEIEPNEDGTPSTGGSVDGNDYVGVLTPGGPFTSDVYITGAINPAGDEDMFAITNSTASPVHMTIAVFGTGAIGTCNVDTQIRIRDVITPEPEAAFDDDAGPGLCSLLYYTLPASTTQHVHLMDFGDNSVISAYHLLIDFR